MNPDELLNALKSYTSSEIIHLYIIERKTKPESRPRDRASERFEYFPQQIDLSEDLVPIVQGMLSKTIEKKVNEDVEIKDYEVIDDTEAKILKYTDLGKIHGFQQFLDEKLNGEVKSIRSLEEVTDFEKSWALCYGFYNQELEQWLYCIKKLIPSKMALETSTSQTVVGAIKNGLNSVFDMDTQKLKPFTGFSINLQPSIDMVYFEKSIYIFKKKGFEDITSLTEEFEALANELVSEVEEIDFIDGIEHVGELILNKPSFRNKIIKAKNIGNIDFLKNCNNIKREFNRAGKKLNITFKFDKTGKIVAENEKEAQEIIKVLSEYFKEGIFGGKVFESPAGRLRAETV